MSPAWEDVFKYHEGGRQQNNYATDLKSATTNTVFTWLCFRIKYQMYHLGFM